MNPSYASNCVSESSHVKMSSLSFGVNCYDSKHWHFYVKVEQGYYFMFQLNTCQKLTVIERNVYGCVIATYDNLCLLKECEFQCWFSVILFSDMLELFEPFVCCFVFWVIGELWLLDELDVESKLRFKYFCDSSLTLCELVLLLTFFVSDMNLFC